MKFLDQLNLSFLPNLSSIHSTNVTVSASTITKHSEYSGSTFRPVINNLLHATRLIQGRWDTRNDPGCWVPNQLLHHDIFFNGSVWSLIWLRVRPILFPISCLLLITLKTWYNGSGLFNDIHIQRLIDYTSNRNDPRRAKSGTFKITRLFMQNKLV